ncbi:MAG: AAA family ATPase, partial [Deltaproteobacteria bacterium]|nr:AAA family ATPase [Deltaproteobacteria bacterium]
MTTFDEILAHVVDLLRRQGRVSYGALKRRFDLDDEYLQDLKTELIEAQRLALDEGGRILVWAGSRKTESENRRIGESEQSSVEFQASSSESSQPVAAIPSDSELRTPNSPRLSADRLAGDRLAGERRQLTVMFCDLVGSTALSTQLDPEELRTVVRTYQAICAEAVERYDGYIAQYLGDGVLVYFGYPMAHEDDAERAVRAGLELLRSLQQYNRHQQALGGLSAGNMPQVRIGIHTGLVVVGEIGGGGKYEHLALGETPNVAARVQGMAPPDTIVISASTYRRMGNAFACRSLGVHALKGIPQPLEILRVEAEQIADPSLQEKESGRVALLVGRTEESEFLRRRWARVKERQGQVVLISGEPGIGKSRLAREVCRHVAEEDLLQLELRCSPYHQHSALYPVIEFFRRMLQIQPEEAADATVKKLERALSHSHIDLEQTLPLLASLLSLPPTRFPLPALTPQKQKEKTAQAILAWVLRITARRPVLLVWEDLHWADPSTLALLDLFVEQAATTSVFVVLTFRPEFGPSWTGRSHVTSLMLSRLGRAHVEAMVAQMIGGKTLPPEVQQQILAKTDGVPLFVEELTTMVLESGLLREEEDHYKLSGPLPPLAIPETLHDSLVARLDRLGAAREVAQLAATLGREFSYELMKAVSPLTEEQLHHALAQLVEAEVLYPRGIGGHASYSFKHALIQEAAYQSLLKSRRQSYHQQIARVLEAQGGKSAAPHPDQPELIAHHYTEAGLIAQALPYWQQAGQAALRRSANQEAIGHLAKALALLETLPETEDRGQMELALRITVGVPLMTTKGYAAPDVEQTFARARALCQTVGDAPRRFSVLSGLFAFYLVKGDLVTARDLAEQCLRLAEDVRDVALLIEAHRMLCNIFHFMGEPTAVVRHADSALALYDRHQHRTLAFLFGQDPAVVCHSFAAMNLRVLGYSAQAIERNQAAVNYARELAHANSLGLALAFASTLYGFMRNWTETLAFAEEAIALAHEQRLVFWGTIGALNRGRALVGLGRYDEGLALLQEGITAYGATGADLASAGNLCVLAENYGNAGRAAEGLRLIAESLALVEMY